MNEQLSAFLDNETTRDEADSVVNALLRDPALRASWSRQHWLRTTLRAHGGETPVALDPGFSSRVMHAIATDEAPETITSAPVLAASQARRGRERRGWRRRRITGLAAAASAAGIAFLIGNPLATNTRAGAGAVAGSSVPALEHASGNGSTRAKGTGQTTAIADSARSSTTSNAGAAGSTFDQGVLDGTENAAASTRTVAVGAGADERANHWSVSDPALENELNGYLVEHNGLARSYGMSGTTPAFVRVATYGQETTQ